MMSAPLTRQHFEPHLGSIFEVRPANAVPVPVELVAVEDRSNSSLDIFSLLFRGEQGIPVFRHDTWRVTHPVMGDLELFLGPVQAGKSDAVYYQAVFSAPKEVKKRA